MRAATSAGDKTGAGTSVVGGITTAGVVTVGGIIAGNTVGGGNTSGVTVGTIGVGTDGIGPTGAGIVGAVAGPIGVYVATGVPPNINALAAAMSMGSAVGLANTNA